MAKKARVHGPPLPPKLQGKSIFLAGNLHHHDALVRKLVALEGGKIAAELTHQTDFVILGYSRTAHAQAKVTKLNAQGSAIQLLTFAQLGAMVRPTPDEAVQLLLGGPDGIRRWNESCDADGRLVGWRSGPTPAYIRGADLSGADLSDADLGETGDEPLEGCDLSDANLSGARVNLIRCRLAGAKLEGVGSLHLVECEAPNLVFTNRDLDHAEIESTDLSGSRFASKTRLQLECKKCNFDRADLSGLVTFDSRFLDCSLRRAKLAGAELADADFSGSDLSDADFTNADLTLVKFNGAKVDGADFTGATLAGVDPGAADFSKAKGFDAGQAQGKGTVGSAVNDLLAVAMKAQKIETTLAVTRGSQTAVLSVRLYQHWCECNDSAGNRYSNGYRPPYANAATVWSKLVTKWRGATPELGSVKVSASKSPLARKELQELALRAWCELFGVEPPSKDHLKQSVATSKTQKKQKEEEWLALLRTGKKGVEQWNENIDALATMLAKLSAVDLANAKLAGVQLRTMQWKSANFAAADLSKAIVRYCRFPEGNLAGAVLKGADCHGTSFADTNLDGADLRAAELRQCSFKRASCKGANFGKAKLCWADLCGADLKGADLDGADLDHASYDEETVWPKGFAPTLEMTWKGPGTSPAAHKLVQATRPKGKLDIEQFMKRLEELTDAAKLGKALAMLRADRFRLYAQVADDHFVGVVKSQSDAELVYSCRLGSDGAYACCTQNLNVCGGLRGSLCKHLLVLLVGLTKNGELDPNAIDTWIRLSKTMKPALDKEAMSETLLRYKGAEAGEVDWRPSETIPEDYYAM